jgi:hypothetical protein
MLNPNVGKATPDVKIACADDLKPAGQGMPTAVVVVGWAVVKKFAASPAGAGVMAWAQGR